MCFVLVFDFFVSIFAESLLTFTLVFVYALFEEESTFLHNVMLVRDMVRSCFQQELFLDVSVEYWWKLDQIIVFFIRDQIYIIIADTVM